MGDSFKKIKKAARLVCLIKALAMGLAVALPLSGILLLLRRFERVPLSPTAIYLIGGGSFVLVACLALLLLWRSDKAIAKWLDARYGLKEKVQTMLAFSDGDGAMLALMRKDAEAALASVGRCVPGLRRLWIYLTALLVGLAVCVTSFFFAPAPPAPPAPEPEVPFAVTELQLLALEELIARVEASEMSEPYKSEVAERLTSFGVSIREVSTVSDMEELTGTVMADILAVTDASSAVLELINELWATGDGATGLLAKTLNYYENDTWDKFVEAMSDYRIAFRHAEEGAGGVDEAELISDTMAVLTSHHQGILAALERSGVPTADPLYTVLLRLATAREDNADGTRVYGMLTLAELVEQNGYTWTQRELDATVAALNGDIFRVLSQNNVNTDTGEGAVTSLAAIFGVRAPAFERPYFGSDSDSGVGEGGVSGGISGGPTYGSGDKVYDPFTNRYVEYGAILDKYYGIMFGSLEGGQYTDEEKKMLEEYFSILYSGFDKKDDQEND